MNFKLTQKDNKTEIYKSDLGNNLKSVVHMYRHLKYWDVTYYIEYPPHYRSEIIFGRGYIESRKEARKIAQKVMSEARPDDWKTKLSEFYRESIKKSASKTPDFMKIYRPKPINTITSI